MATRTNSLGLDFDALNIKDEAITDDASKVSTPKSALATPHAASELTKDDADAREKKKPYVNPERVKTGGTQRDKLTEEELTERMNRIKEQNEKIKQRRVDIQADEDAFKKTQEVERARQIHNRQIQDNVNRTREQNARRKMDKVQSREWDSGKPSTDWKDRGPPRDDAKTSSADTASPRGGGGRGGRGGRGRGRGRGGPPFENNPRATDKPSQPPQSEQSPAATPAPVVL